MTLFYTAPFVFANRYRDERLAKPVFGASDYSWHIIADIFRFGLAANDLTATYVSRPEIYFSSQAKALLSIPDPASSHMLQLRPLEQIRPLPGISNSAYILWEFTEFSESSIDDNIYYNHKRILESLDICLTATTFQSENLLKALRVDSKVLPLPLIDYYTSIPSKSVNIIGSVPIVSSISAEHSSLETLERKIDLESFLRTNKKSTTKVILSMLNPFDVRKNMLNLFKALQIVEDDNLDALFIIKIICDDTHTKDFHLPAILFNQHLSSKTYNRVFVSSTILDDPGIRFLYSLSDALLVPSASEGLNLPAIQAISWGLPVITPLHSAMSSYLTPDTCYQMSFQSCKAPLEASRLSLSKYLTFWPPSPEDIKGAIDAYLASSYNDSRERADLAKKHIGLQYNHEMFRSVMEEITR